MHFYTKIYSSIFKIGMNFKAKYNTYYNILLSAEILRVIFFMVAYQSKLEQFVYKNEAHYCNT